MHASMLYILAPAFPGKQQIRLGTCPRLVVQSHYCRALAVPLHVVMANGSWRFHVLW